MAREGIRVIGICEDEKQRSFLLRLCARLGMKRPDILPAPPGQGSAEQWIREQLVRQVIAFRQQAHHQRNLALLVMTDGDRLGLAARKQSLDARLHDAGRPTRGTEERIVYLVPTWSIETWLAWLCGAASSLPGFGEGIRYKQDAAYNALVESGAISTKLAVENWLPAHGGEGSTVPSLSDARIELARIP